MQKGERRKAKSADWRTESRTVYSNDVKLRIVELAYQPRANVAKIARESGVVHNLIFKWLRMWQHEGRVSRRLPAAIAQPSAPSLLAVEIVPEATVSDVASGLYPLNASSCCVEFRHSKITLKNPSQELLAVLLRELTGRAPE
ncbi:transposase [Scandinavium tedordense]|uniref:transposase n=1 Tax=Scandinavium tedordense TaxID=2926521 RepID=UPI002869BED6|nr:transposase [Scandinavium tedordense]